MNTSTFDKKLRAILKEWKPSYLSACVKNGLDKEAQIEFISDYIGFMLLSGKREQNLQRIDYFLSMQLEQDGKHFYRLIFYPDEVTVYIDAHEDIDLDDIQSILNYEIISVRNKNYKKWSNKAAEKFVDRVKEDLDFDGEDASLDFAITDNELTIVLGSK